MAAPQTEPRPGQKVVDIVMPTFIMSPGEDDRFYPSETRAIAQKVLEEELGTEPYDEDAAKEKVLTICNKIKDQCRALQMPRYKLIVQASVGENKDQGVRIASRSLWDTNTDNYASATYANQSLWASVIVFGVYAE